jgi:hypothetical protein
VVIVALLEWSPRTTGNSGTFAAWSATFFVTHADLSLSHYWLHKMFNDTVSDLLSPVSRFGKHFRSATLGELP